MTTISEKLQHSQPFLLFENTLPAHTDEQTWLFTDPLCEIVAYSREAFFNALAKIDQERQKGHYLAGYISYEAGYALSHKLSDFLNEQPSDKPLIQFYAFDKVQHTSSQDITQALNELPESDPYIHNWQATESQAQYLKNLEKLHQYIAAGDTYQVNHTYRVNFDLAGSINGLYKTLRQRQPVAFSALMHLPERSILSLSPELFVRKEETTLSTKPMKGTMPRGSSLEEDEAILKTMASDKKQQSENLMIVDLMRNDIGRLADAGSMKVSKLFEIETYKTLHQMISSIEGEVSKEITFSEVINGLFPCGSITGAPKIRTMEIIHELENTPRDIYTGAIGFITPDNDFTFNVPIRTITFPKGSKQGTLGIGGGIIYESDPVDEWHESKLKARFITGINRQFKLIETLRYDATNKQVLRLEKHLKRLEQSASCFDYPVDVANVAQMINCYVKQQSDEFDLKLRVLLNEAGGIDISSETLPVFSDSATSLSIKELVKSVLQIGEHALGRSLPKVYLSPIKLDETNLFRQHKSTNRALYNTAYKKAEADGFYDVLFLNRQGNLAEASRHNLLVRQGITLYTPPLKDGALPGVMREELLATGDELVGENGFAVIEKSLTLEDLRQADRVYLSNSVRGLVEVEFIGS